MDIVGKIGQYFADHEAQLRLAMRRNLNQKHHLPTPDEIKTASDTLDSCLSSFSSTMEPPHSARSATTSPLYIIPPPHSKSFVGHPPPASEPSPVIQKSGKRSSKRKKPKKAREDKRTEKMKASLEAERKQKAVEEALFITKERARKIQLEKELQLKAQEAQLAEKLKRRDEQLQQIESIRKQAFKAKTNLPPRDSSRVEISDVWTEPSRPRRASISIFKPTKPLVNNVRARSASFSTRPTSPILNNQTERPSTPSPRIDPITKFGPIQDLSPTPYLDRLEHLERFRLERKAILQSHKAQYEQYKQSCAEKQLQNNQLEQKRQQLEAQKQQLEAALRSLDNETTQGHFERHKVAMHRRMARRNAAKMTSNNSNPQDTQEWIKDNQEQANHAAKDKNDTRRSVQAIIVKNAGPETMTNNEGGWHISPLSKARWENAFFSYSSSEDE